MINRGENFRNMVAFFEQNDLRYQIHPIEPLVFMQMTGENGTWSFLAMCDDLKDRFSTISSAPIRVPVPKRAAAAEYLTRANWGLAIGNFELDYSDGEIRYKVSMDTDGIQLNEQLIGQAVAVNCRMMDRYLPGLMAVVFSNESPEEAIHGVEMEPEDQEGPSPSEIDDIVRRLVDGPTNDETDPSLRDEFTEGKFTEDKDSSESNAKSEKNSELHNTKNGDKNNENSAEKTVKEENASTSLVSRFLRWMQRGRH